MRKIAQRTSLILGVLGLASLAAAGAGLAQAQKQQDSTRVDDIVVRPDIVPVPLVGDGAPLITPTELATEANKAKREYREARDAFRMCSPTGIARMQIGLPKLFADEEAAQNALVAAAQAAEKATAEATQVRIDAAKNKATMQDVEQAELDRQAAVKVYVAARTAALESRARTADYQAVLHESGDRLYAWSEIERRSAQRKVMGAFEVLSVPDEYLDLKLTKVSSAADASGTLRVTGEIENPRPKAVSTPPLQIAVVDRQGGILAMETADAGSGRKIKPNGSLPFVYDVKAATQNGATVLVTFGDRVKAPWHYSAAVFCDRTGNSRGRSMGGLNNQDRTRINRLGLHYGGGASR